MRKAPFEPVAIPGLEEAFWRERHGGEGGFSRAVAQKAYECAIAMIDAREAGNLALEDAIGSAYRRGREDSLAELGVPEDLRLSLAAAISDIEANRPVRQGHRFRVIEFLHAALTRSS